MLLTPIILIPFLLGMLYRDEPLLTPDYVEARYWFEQAAYTLPDAQYSLGKLLLANDDTHGQHTDHKLRQRIQGKKIAMGHRPDDHEEQSYIGPAM